MVESEGQDQFIDLARRYARLDDRNKHVEGFGC